MFTCQGTRPDRLAFRPPRSAVCGSGGLLSDDRIPHPPTIVNNNFAKITLLWKTTKTAPQWGGMFQGK